MEVMFFAFKKHSEAVIIVIRKCLERSHEQYGSAAKQELSVISNSISDNSNIEIFTMQINNITVTSVYKTPNVDYFFL